MQHSDFENSTKGTTESRPLELSVDTTISQVASALNQGDHERAGILLREALERAPDDQKLLRLAARQRRQAERFSRVYSLLEETREAMEADEFVRAVGAFREAANLSRGFSDLEQATFHLGVAEAGRLGDRNWRIARSMFEDAGSIHPQLVVPERFWAGVKGAEREETIANVLEETALAKPAELGRARERLARTLEQYPDNAGLANRLKSIESTIEDKRKWDERQKCLKRVTDLRDALQREEDPAQVGKYIPQSEVLSVPYTAEPEFSIVLDDIKHQVLSGERAVTALKQDRIEDCLEECASVLSRMRHHQLFLNLKKRAEERELSLADEYSNAVSSIKELLAAGQLAEADALCSEASTKLPQFTDLAELKREIEERRSKERDLQENAESARRLTESGEKHLREHRYGLAEQAFSGALNLMPEDAELSGHLVGLLHGYARSVVSDNAQTAEEVLRLTARILPGTAVPADLAEAVRQKREQGNFASAGHADVWEAAPALFGKIDRTVAMKAKQRRRPDVYRVLVLSATVVVVTSLAYWMNSRAPSPVREKWKTVSTTESVQRLTAPQPNPRASATGSLVIRSEVPGVQVAVGGQQYTVSNKPLRLELNANSYIVSGSRPGYNDFGPLLVAVVKAAETDLDVNLTPKLANLEIRGAEPDTQIKLDGVLLGTAAIDQALIKEVPAGEHSIELSRNGFLSKTLTRNVEPGGSLVLTASDLQLESSDALSILHQPSFAEISPGNSAIAKSANSSHSAAAAQAKTDDLRWQAVDQNSPDALRAFVSQYPDSRWSNQAKQQMDSILVAREDGDWRSTDRNSRSALEDFLKRHADGRHAADASTALAEIDRKARLAEAQSAEDAAWKKVNQRDEASLESYLRDTPNSPYRSQAETVLANIRVRRSSANETAAVLTVISRLASAWSAKDLDSILAIQRNLSKRVVKAELSQVKELEMQISPASPPQIDGTQAVVLCRRQALQTFSDGTRKQAPETIVSYVLAKHDGNWTIEGTR